MKGLFKLTTAALALVAFASCSNDDFFSSDKVQSENFTSVLEVSVEEPDFGVITRAGRKDDATGFKWQADDQIRVYDVDLGVYDVYKYSTVFGRTGATNLEKDPAYALFPAEDIKRGYWDPTLKHVAEVEIPEIITYSKTNGAEVEQEDGTVLYKMFVPMQGKVEKVDDATVKVLNPGMQSMTGVLYLTLNQGLGNASYIKLSSATKALSGRFIALLDEENPELTTSSDPLIAASYSGDLYIDLRNLPSDKCVLYIPVIAGVSDLKVYRTTDATIGGATWTLVTNLDTYTFKRNAFKKVEYTYELAADCPVELNAALAQYNEQATDVTLNITKNFNIDAGNAAVGQTVKFPAMACDVVTLNFKNDVTNATPNNLILKDLNTAAPFTGTLVVNVANKLLNGSKLPLEIDLPEAKVVIVGDYTQGTPSTLTVTEVDELEFGDGTNTTKFTQTGMGLSNVTTAIKINNNATITDDGTLNAGATATVEVANGGRITGGGTINLTGDLTIIGTVENNITTKGNVTIARTSDGIALANDKTLTFERAKTLTMKRGYIGTVTNDFDDLGEADGHTVNITFDETGLTAIKYVTVSTTDWDDSNIVFTNESTWTGAVPTSITGFIGSIGTTKAIYTAAQLVNYKGATGPVNITLGNNINLNNDPNSLWTAPIGDGTGTVTIVGGNHTIKNLNLNNLAYGSAGVGLVGAATDLTVSGLTLDNVQFTKAYTTHQTASSAYMISAVGGLAGLVTGDTDLDNVTVNLADNFGYSSYTVGGNGTQKVEVDATKVGIGGVIGIAVGDIDFANVDVTGTKIQGYTSLGGFIGFTTGASTFDKKCSSAITGFSINYNDPAATNIEMNIARAGGFIGYTTDNVTIKNGATTNDVAISGDGYKTSKLYVSVAAGEGVKLYNYAANQQWIGFSENGNIPCTSIGRVLKKETNSDGSNFTPYIAQNFDGNGNLAALGTTGTKNNQALYTWTVKANAE